MSGEYSPAPRRPGAPEGQSSGPATHVGAHAGLPVRLLRLYPVAWRERYGAELADLLAGERFTLPLLFTLCADALDARLHPRMPLDRRDTSDGLRLRALAIFCAYGCALGLAAFLVEVMRDLVEGPALRRGASLSSLTAPSVMFLCGIGLIALALVGGGAPILFAVVRDAWQSRRGEVRLLAVLPGTVLLLGGCDALAGALDTRAGIAGGPFSFVAHALFHILAVGAALVCAGVLAHLVLNSAVADGYFRRSLVPAALGAVGLVMMLGASLLWLARARGVAPSLFAAASFDAGVVALVLLLAGVTGLATWHALRAVARDTATF